MNNHPHVSKLFSNEELKDLVLTYDDAIDMVVNSLKNVKNIKNFCEEHDLCYQNVLLIRKKRDERYPMIIQSLLKLLFGIETDFRPVFFIKI